MVTDPFAGTWKCNLDASRLLLAPRSWIQKIEITGEWIHVQEEIVGPDGATALVSVQTKFDGTEYPVSGSAIAESITYVRQGKDYQ